MYVERDVSIVQYDYDYILRLLHPEMDRTMKIRSVILCGTTTHLTTTIVPMSGIVASLPPPHHVKKINDPSGHRCRRESRHFIVSQISTISYVWYYRASIACLHHTVT
jgi:hypothetical protein